MTPRQLKYFIEIARSGSITTAANALHIAQPALSHHIAAMEEELDVVLFDRHARGVKLTVAGQRLLERATSILRQMDRLKDDVQDASTQPRGLVSLCIVNSVSLILAAPLLRLLERRAPQVQLQLSSAMSREAHALVEAGRVDLALLPTGAESPRMQAVPAFEERLCLFGRQHLFGDARGPMPFREIGDRPLIAPDHHHDLRKMIERTALAQNCPLNVRYQLSSADLLRSLVKAGLGFSIMPRNAFPDDEARGIVVREIVDPDMARTQSIVWMADHALTPAGEAVRNALLELIAELIDNGTLKARLLA